MKIKLIFKLLLGFNFFCTLVFLTFNAKSQNIPRCATTKNTQELLDAHPEYLPQIKKATSDLEIHTMQYINQQNQSKQAATQVYVIPVVFHIIHQNGAENISNATVFDAIRTLNEDYRLWNSDTNEIDQSFKPIIGNAFIEYRLAQIDPLGNPTNGIDRIVSAETNVGDDGSKLNPWARSKYLNIWTVKTFPCGGAAACAYLPSTVSPGAWAAVDGIIANYTYIGNGGRTLTHECGHWINLLHPWGPSNDPGLAGNCSSDDGVSDTPNTIGVDDSSCDTNQVTCSTLDNVQNYMDYASCEQMFTLGQVSRMRAALNSTTAQRSSLWTTSNLIATGVYDGAAVFSAGFTVVCPGSTVVFQDESYNGITNWEWSFPGAVPDTSNLRSPSVVYEVPGTYDVTLKVSNDTGSITLLKPGYIKVTAARTMPYSEEFFSFLDWYVVNNGGNAWEFSSASYGSGSGSIKIQNYTGNTNGDVDKVYGPVLDLSVFQSAQIQFKVAYAQKPSLIIDLLRLYTSNDCGIIWNSSWLSGGAALAGTNGAVSTEFTPADTNSWTLFSVNLVPSLLKENFRFMFEFTFHDGNNIYLDDINITGVYKPIPILVSPTNFATAKPLIALLDWKAVPNVDKYQFEIDTTAGFTSSFLITGETTYIDSLDTGTDTEYLLSGLDSNQTVYWRVRTISGVDTFEWSSVWRFTTAEPVPVGLIESHPSDFKLHVFPNPAKDVVTVSFTLSHSANTAIQVFDILGREVMSLSNSGKGPIPAGSYNFLISGFDKPGIYLIRVSINNYPYYQKITINL